MAATVATSVYAYEDGMTIPKRERKPAFQGQMPTESLLREALRVEWFTTHAKHAPPTSTRPPCLQIGASWELLMNISERIKTKTAAWWRRENEGIGRWRRVGWRVMAMAMGTVGLVCYLYWLVFLLPFYASVALRWWCGLHFAVQEEKKRGQSAEDGVEEKREEEEEGRGDAEEGDERGRAESTATPPPPFLFSVFFFQFPSLKVPLYRKHGHKKWSVRGNFKQYS